MTCLVEVLNDKTRRTSWVRRVIPAASYEAALAAARAVDATLPAWAAVAAVELADGRRWVID